MWLLTPDGFYSIVQKPGESDLCVRARDRGDLERLRSRYLPQLTEVEETPDGDYRFRAWATHDQVAAALAQIARDLDYGNFKDAVARRDPGRASVYGEVWSLLGRLQEGGPYGWGE